jgi:hypothetical protein
MTYEGSHTMGRVPVVYDGIRLDLVDELAEEISRHAGARSAPSLNEGGWKSGNLANWTSSAVRDLISTLQEATSAIELEAWAMINRHGSRHPRHVHRGAIFAGVYYVSPGGEASPPTIFEMPDGSEFIAEPIAGRLVIFPGDLYHRVPLYIGDEPRITVAFDVKRIAASQDAR